MKVLYYAHHHGSGHFKNSEYFASILKKDLWVATSKDIDKTSVNLQIVTLANEDETTDDIVPGRLMLPNYLHYSPIGNPDIRERSYQLINACYQNKIELVIVDLSVEVATLLRAASIPFAYVRLPGNRNDTPHMECYRAALFLLAYYPEELEDAYTPSWVKDKTVYLDFLYVNIKSTNTLDKLEQELIEKHQPFNLVVKGFGGHSQVDEGVESLKKIKPGYYVSLGPVETEYRNVYDCIIKFSKNVKALMEHSNRIIIPPSLNLTAEALNSHKPVTIIPAERHFDEHIVMARNLMKQGYADSIDNLRNDFKAYTPSDKAEKFIVRLKETVSAKSLYKELQEL